MKNHQMNFFHTWPSIRLIHIERNTGVSNKLKHFKAANFQRQLRKIFLLFSLMLFAVLITSRITMLLYISVYYEFIKRAIAFRRLSRGMLKYPELAQ